MQYQVYNGYMKKAELLEHAGEYFSKEQVVRLDKAVTFASKAHKGQKRKSGDPYIFHPLETADILVSWGMDMDSIIAGVLHDVVEDTEATLEQINEEFGPDVAKLVDGVTKISKTRADMKDMDNYLPRTRENLSKLLIAISNDVRVIIIKLADRLHNLNTLEFIPKDKQRKVSKESLEVFGPMADRLGMGHVRMQIEDIAYSYLDPKEYKRLKVAMKKRLGKSTRKLGQIRIEVEEALNNHAINAEINGRVKSVYSLHKKLAKVNGNIDDIYDLMALRIIVDKKEDCYQVLGILHTLYKPMINRIKDYISTPKPNGYQSLHTTVITPNEQIVEFQIRTKAMHIYAERGLASNYNQQKLSKDYIRKRSVVLPENLTWITQLNEVADRLKNDDKINEDQMNIDLFGNRIFVHSPKGDIYDLPEGALPLDFAYLVHSDIGRHAKGFKVNGRIHAFDKPLQNGDIIEVITGKTTLPNQSWQNLVKTTHAKNKLNGQLRKSGVVAIISGAANIIQRKKAKK